MDWRSVLSAVLLISVPMMVLMGYEGVIGSGDWSMDIDLANSDTNITTDGPLGDLFGEVVRIIGDVNGDGYDDIAVGAPRNDSESSRAGQVYFFFGSRNGLSSNLLAREADASYLGEGMTDFLGDVIQGAGDINGDGYDDVLVGCDMTGGAKGRTHLILGKGSDWKMNLSITSSDAIFEGPDSTEIIGHAVCDGIDLNYDGFDDIIFSSKTSNRNGTNSGHTFIFFGRPEGYSGIISASKADASLMGSLYDNSGWSLASAGDVNGDDYEDLMVGALTNRAGYVNKVYLVFGGPKSIFSRNMSLSMADASFERESAQDSVGRSISGSGDVNGDGYDDMLIGAHDNDEHGNLRGQVYLILGRKAPWSMGLSLSTANASFYGEMDSDTLGRAVAGGGDVNGDGYDDFIIGADQSSEHGSSTGQSYVIFGCKSGWSIDTPVSIANASYYGVEDSYSGYSVSMAGDVNGDGYDDIMIGCQDGSRGYAWLVLKEINDGPLPINHLKVFADPSYTKTTNYGDASRTYYIEIDGTDPNSTRIDLATVFIGGYVVPIRKVVLTETGTATGLYRAAFQGLEDMLPGEDPYYGSVVNFSSVHDPGKFWEVTISHPRFELTSYNNPVLEDDEIVWSYEYENYTHFELEITTEADFLYVDMENMSVRGIPNNTDVGDFGKIKFEATTEWGSRIGTWRDLYVINRDPEILTIDAPTAIEDEPYLIDYNSTDDGQGNISWYLSTSAEWLSLDNQTGELFGTPTNDDVGKHEVNVSVNDGNGGWDWSIFNLTVENVNDPPVIEETILPDALEDEWYNASLNAYDIDPSSFIEWSLNTTADWLEINRTTGSIYGLPLNKDVGQYNLNVSIVDGDGGDHHRIFTLNVLNVNDPPLIVSEDVSTVIEGEYYSNDYDAVDIDPTNDTLTWNLATNASWLSLDTNTGRLTGSPGYDDSGTYSVNVSVSDGNDGSDHHQFTITVIDAGDEPVNHPPVLTLGGVDPSAGDINTTFAFSVVYTDIDEQGSPNVTVVIDGLDYEMLPITGNMHNGSYVFSTKLSVGDHSFYFKASDGELDALSGDETPITMAEHLSLMVTESSPVDDDDDITDDDVSDDDTIDDDDDAAGSDGELPVLWILLVIVVMIAALAGLVIWSRRGKDDPEE